MAQWIQVGKAEGQAWSWCGLEKRLRLSDSDQALLAAVLADYAERHPDQGPVSRAAASTLGVDGRAASPLGTTSRVYPMIPQYSMPDYCTTLGSREEIVKLYP
jgi:hypothetical protein